MAPVAIVTGAASGIGLATVAALACDGATVVMVDRDESVAQAAEQLRDEPGTIQPVTGDVTDESTVRAIVAEVIHAHGKVDWLVNNAGTIEASAEVVKQTWAQWKRIMEVNAGGAFLYTREVLPGMLERRQGAVVNVASISGLVGLPDQAAYCMSKGAMVQLTRQVAVEYSSRGIRCNAVCPGTVETPLLARGLSLAADPEAARSGLLVGHPIGRFAQPDEIAGAIRFLLSDEASFVSGAILSVDGGYVAK